MKYIVRLSPEERNKIMGLLLIDQDNLKKRLESEIDELQKLWQLMQEACVIEPAPSRTVDGLDQSQRAYDPNNTGPFKNTPGVSRTGL